MKMSNAKPWVITGEESLRLHVFEQMMQYVAETINQDNILRKIPYRQKLRQYVMSGTIDPNIILNIIDSFHDTFDDELYNKYGITVNMGFDDMHVISINPPTTQ
jgi:hypothetical protein